MSMLGTGMIVAGLPLFIIVAGGRRGPK